MVLPPHLFAALTHWVKAGHSRRGLEKFCVTSHIRTRPLAKAATVQAVLLAQDLLRQQRDPRPSPPQASSRQDADRFLDSSSSPSSSLPSSSPSQGWMGRKRATPTPTPPPPPSSFHIGTSEFPLDERIPQDEILRLVSERFTKTSRYYGTAMGHADAAAVGNYVYPSSSTPPSSTISASTSLPPSSSSSSVSFKK
jgi:hypothetical protein